MNAKSNIEMRAGPFLTGVGYSLADTGYWRVAVIIIAAACVIMFLVTQFGRGVRLEKGAETAFSRAQHLLHEADKENRNVRPSPLSLARAMYIPGTGELGERIGSLNAKLQGPEVEKL
jgi:hypothetical protein